MKAKCEHNGTQMYGLGNVTIQYDTAHHASLKIYNIDRKIITIPILGSIRHIVLNMSVQINKIIKFLTFPFRNTTHDALCALPIGECY